MQTVDNYWAAGDVCRVPGIPGTYPAGLDLNDVCGGQDGVKKIPLQDEEGTTYGEVHLARTYDSELYLTATIKGSVDGQWYYEYPEQGGRRRR